MSGQLQGRVAVVTGGSRGVGKGIAEELAEEGAVVYVTGRSVGGGKTGAESGRIVEQNSRALAEPVAPGDLLPRCGRDR